jgi:hydrogenase maturation protease
MTLVIGLGNADRGDDAVGLAVAAAIRRAAPPGVTVTELAGDQLDLLDAWSRAAADGDAVFVIDAVRSGAPPGTVHRLTPNDLPSVALRPAGTHTLTLAEVIGMARALSTNTRPRLPARLTCFGIEATTFAPGAPMSAPVADAVEPVAAALLREINALSPERRDVIPGR